MHRPCAIAAPGPKVNKPAHCGAAWRLDLVLPPRTGVGRLTARPLSTKLHSLNIRLASRAHTSRHNEPIRRAAAAAAPLGGFKRITLNQRERGGGGGSAPARRLALHANPRLMKTLS